MRLSKYLFIAMVALCLVFMRVSAEPGDEVAVEGEGEAVAPGGQAVEGAAEVGESQAAQDIMRTQMATTRGPSRSQAPSKAQKSNKLKIAIVIGLILVLLAGAMLGGYFLILRPRAAKKKDEELANFFKAGLSKDFECNFKKLGDDKKEKYYIEPKNKGKPTDAQAKQMADFGDMLSKVDGVKKDGDKIVVPLKKVDTVRAAVKGVKGKVGDDAKMDEAMKSFAKVCSDNIFGDKVQVSVGGGNIVFTGLSAGGSGKSSSQKPATGGSKAAAGGQGGKAAATSQKAAAAK